MTTPAGTTAVVRVSDSAGTPLTDSVLSGNGAGFSSFPISLTGISIVNYPTLTISAELTSNATTTTSQILDWSLSYTVEPLSLQNVPFTLTGTKTIGTDANNTPIYKTVLNDTTGTNATKTETLEWDSYSLKLNGDANLIESCSASPYTLAPDSSTSVTLLVGAPTTNTLPLIVENSSGVAVASANVILAKSGYAATIPTSACGFSYFSNLSTGVYGATVSANGYATTTFSNINVAGHTATTTLTLP